MQPNNETWEIAVADSLGLISSQDDIAGAVELYRKPAILKQLELLDRTEYELRRFLPKQCFLLSLFTCARREISWLLPSAADPATVTRQCLGRFCRMLFVDSTAQKMFAWYRKELKPYEAGSLLKAIRPFLQQMPYRPSLDAVQALCNAMAARQSLEIPFARCVKSLEREYPHVAPTAFSPSIDSLRDAVSVLRTYAINLPFSPSQKQGVLAALCNAAGIPLPANPQIPQVFVHPMRIDDQGFDAFPPMEFIWRYMKCYVHGMDAEMNLKFGRLLPDAQNQR